jgi:hypothetical protein
MKMILRAQFAILVLIVPVRFSQVFSQEVSTAEGRDVLRPNPQTTYEPGLHLLVDPEMIVESHDVTVIMNQPVKLPEPVITSTWRPYRYAAAWGNVIREPNGLFRMWYLDLIVGPHDHANRKVWGDESDYGYHPQHPGDYRDVDLSFICYAESWDGIHWDKPALGIVEFEDSTANNIVLNGCQASKQFDGAITNMDGCTVVRDDRDPDPNRRYKMLAYWETVHRYDNRHNGLHRPEADIKRFNNKNTRGHYIACSPDGIHFGKLEPSGLPKIGIDRNLVMRDYKRSQWRAYLRPDIPANEYVKNVRAAGLSTSSDFRNWSKLETVLVPDEEDLFGAIRSFSSLIPFNYGQEDLGFLVTDDSCGTATYLVCMDKDNNWKRLYRDRPIIPYGIPGSFDRRGVSPTHNEPIIVGDELYIYYSAASAIKNHPAGYRSIGLAKLRRDAFVGVAPGVSKTKSEPNKSGEPTFTTRPLKVSANNLVVNFENLIDDSRLLLELLDENKNPIPGYTRDDCFPVGIDSIRAPVKWKSRNDLSSLIGKEVSIRVSFVNSVVYAFKFYDTEKP